MDINIGIFIKLTKVLFILLSFYVISMVFVYSLPDFNLKENVYKSSITLKNEGEYPVIAKTLSFQTRLDNFTDLKIMSQRSYNNSGIIKSSMDMNGYARYWHGYQLILKPLLSFFTYEKIRFIYNIMLSASLIACCAILWIYSSPFNAISLMIAMCFVHVEVIGMSIQFSNVFIITLLFSYFLMIKKNENVYGISEFCIIFFIIGSVVNFVDLLTAPLVSLGIPLVCLIATGRSNSITDLKSSIYYSMMWAAGYSITWISKWIIGSVMLDENVFKSAVHQIFFRTMGNSQYPINREVMFDLNFTNMFGSYWSVLFILFPFILGIVLYKRVNIFSTLTLLMISLMPYLWYMVLSGHSQIHSWMTYRVQIITIFSSLVMYWILLQPNRRVNTIS
ncbi:TPA: hypothetical protein ACGSH4_004395 [Escherichia coli]|nr:hypothetical protein [Escherichia coli]